MCRRRRLRAQQLRGRPRVGLAVLHTQLVDPLPERHHAADLRGRMGQLLLPFGVPGPHIRHCSEVLVTATDVLLRGSQCVGELLEALLEALPSAGPYHLQVCSCSVHPTLHLRGRFAFAQINLLLHLLRLLTLLDLGTSIMVRCKEAKVQRLLCDEPHPQHHHLHLLLNHLPWIQWLLQGKKKSKL